LVFPGESLNEPDVEFIRYHLNHRHYNRLEGNRLIWNYDFKVQPGEFFFSASEQECGLAPGFVVIEPNVNRGPDPATDYLINKQWHSYGEVADRLLSEHRRVVQFVYNSTSYRLPGATLIQTPSFRYAATILAHASLFIGPEGGMAHAAAALNVPAVVLFGGWGPPAVLGYDSNTNLTGGETHFCGQLEPCTQCAAAMERIGAGEVYEAARTKMEDRH